MTAAQAAAQLRVPAIVTGVGLGGFFDGIFLHQVFQLHHMLSNTEEARFGIANYDETTIAGLRTNVLWDGLFHVTTYILVVVGLALLWRALQRMRPVRPPWSLLWGGLLAGWGGFNLVEGVVNHHVLAIHHVYDTGDPTTTLVLDLLFLTSGVALMAVGRVLMRRGTAAAEPADVPGHATRS
ncbi:MAG TPA: DUF2243 domain-containing protein [Euzebyales bacterium]|nr:DUF2243 domain-containing protein [Euzebyales bacterium]